MKVRINEKQLKKMLARAKQIKKQVAELDNEMNRMFWQVNKEADRLENRQMWLESVDADLTEKQSKELKVLGKLIDKLDSASDKMSNVF